MDRIKNILCAAQTLETTGRTDSAKRLRHSVFRTISADDLQADHLTQAWKYGITDALQPTLENLPPQRVRKLAWELRSWLPARLLFPASAEGSHPHLTPYTPRLKHVVLVAPGNRDLEDLASGLRRLGAEVSLIDSGIANLNAQSNEKAVADLASEFTRLCADVIVAPAVETIAVTALMAAQQTGRPFLLDMSAEKDIPEQTLLRQVARQADHVFYSNLVAPEWLRIWGEADHKISWLPGWLPADPITKPLPGKTSVPVIGVSGTGSALMRALYLCSRLALSGQDFRLAFPNPIVGEEALLERFGLAGRKVLAPDAHLDLMILPEENIPLQIRLIRSGIALAGPRSVISAGAPTTGDTFSWQDNNIADAIAVLRHMLDAPQERQAIAAQASQRGRIDLRLPDAAEAIFAQVKYHSKLASRRPSPPQNAEERINILGWPEHDVHSPLTAMAVVDGFTQDCLAPDMNLVQPRPDNWQDLLERDQPKLLFVESAWQGNGGSWQYRVARYAHPPGQELAAMTAGCRASRIPSIFWNKEDPVHFDNFREAAPLFDHVFTTALEAVPRYQALGCRSVHVMPFAAQPQLHNPIGSRQRNGRICFAGSYYANRFEARRLEQLALLEAAADFGLDIYDRNAGMTGDFNFPGDLSSYVRGKLTYAETCEAYRRYSIFLNVNSVDDSRTMFSRRVFELLACGTPVVSTPSPGIEEMFGDTVLIVRNADEARNAMEYLLGDTVAWRAHSLRGIRKIFRSHCFHHRIDSVLQVAGINMKLTPRMRCAALGFGTGSGAEQYLRQEAARQVLPDGDIYLRLLDPAGMPQDMSAIDALLSDLAARDITHVTILRDGISYAGHCLEDMHHALTYSRAKVVTGSTDPDAGYSWASEVDSNCWLVTLDDLRQAVRFRGPSWITSPDILASHLTAAFPNSLFANGGDGFEVHFPVGGN